MSLTSSSSFDSLAPFPTYSSNSKSKLTLEERLEKKDSEIKKMVSEIQYLKKTVKKTDSEIEYLKKMVPEMRHLLGDMISKMDTNVQTIKEFIASQPTPTIDPQTMMPMNLWG